MFNVRFFQVFYLAPTSRILLPTVPGGGRFEGDAEKGLRQNPSGAAGEEQEEFWQPGCCLSGPLLPPGMSEI